MGGCTASFDKLRIAEVELRMAEVELRMAEVELRMSEVGLRMAEVGLRMAEVELRMAEVVIGTAQAPVHRWAQGGCAWDRGPRDRASSRGGTWREVGDW